MSLTGGLANVDPVVAVSGVTRDSLVFLVESIHGLPSESDASLQFASAVDLKFLPELPGVRGRNFKSKNRTSIIRLLVSL